MFWLMKKSSARKWLEEEKESGNREAKLEYDRGHQNGYCVGYPEGYKEGEQAKAEEELIKGFKEGQKRGYELAFKVIGKAISYDKEGDRFYIEKLDVLMIKTFPDQGEEEDADKTQAPM